MSRSRKGGGGRGASGGGGGKAGKIVFGLFVIMLIVAVYSIPYDPGVKGIFNVGKSKAEHAEQWAQNIGPSIEEFAGGILRGGKPAPTEVGIPEGEQYEENQNNVENPGSYDSTPSGNVDNPGSYEG